MRILLISDSHGNNDRMTQVLEKEKPVDMVIHCGDIEGGEYLLEKTAGCPVHIVSGNNDFFADLPQELELDIEGKRFLVTHGHYYYVSMGVERIIEEARSRGISAVVFGHTHKPCMAWAEDVLAINPGSCAYPRQEGRRHSYAILSVVKNEKISAEIRYL